MRVRGGESKGKPHTVGAFVHPIKALGLGSDGGWPPQAAGSVLQWR